MTTHLETRVIEELAAALSASRKDGAERKKSRWARFWEFVQPVLTTLIPGLVLFAIGYLFLDSAKQRLEERQLGTENAKEVRDLIKEMLRDDIDSRTADSTALAIAAFGRYAVVPLVTVLQAGGESRVLAAEKGIRATALLDRPYTCGVLAEVLGNRSRGFTLLAHKNVIRTADRIGCDDDKWRKSLMAYGQLLAAGDQRYAEAVDTSDANPGQIQSLRGDVDNALKRLGK